VKNFQNVVGSLERIGINEYKRGIMHPDNELKKEEVI
jgi:hypothetical protein